MPRRRAGSDSPARPRVLFLATTLDVGGAERALARLATGLRGRFETEAASLRPATGGVAADLRAAGVPVHDLGAPSKLHAARAVARLVRLVREREIDIVASFLFHANVLARAARALGPRARRPRLVVSIRYPDRERPWRALLERALRRLADRIVCVSEDARRAAKLQPRDPRVVVIPNGVPISAAPAPLAPSAPWLSVARLDPQKGHETLIDAWRLLGPAAPRLLLAGRGPLEGALRARAANLPIDFLGERRDVEALLAAAGGFVLASRDEGLPNALLEAMAAGLPVVATACGGVPEAIAEGVGVLVPPGDARALAAAVAAIAADPARARSLGAAARARALERFSVDRMIADWGDLLAALVAVR